MHYAKDAGMDNTAVKLYTGHCIECSLKRTGCYYASDVI